jgi:predicted acylesterase/phospholipase RssA
VSSVFSRFVILTFIAALMSGCSTISRLPAVPIENGAADRSILGVANARIFVDTEPQKLAEEIARMHRAQTAAAGGRLLGDVNLLALSGGGEYGAFGAGILVGWSERGDRPRFDLVTGVSTGALIAPYAFLGSRYDDALRRVYTTVDTSDVIARRPLPSILGGDAVLDTAPLARLIDDNLSDEMIAQIGQGYREGRLLLVGTTDLDRGQPVIWNVTALAASGHREAPALIRRILLASASIPGAFPPVMFDIHRNGQVFQELHVDGGTTSQAFLYPANLPLRDAPVAARRRRAVAWIIRNGRPAEPPEEVQRGLLPIAGRSIPVLISSNGIGDMYRMYAIARRDGIDYNLAYITDAFSRRPARPFEREFMIELFEHGRTQLRNRASWARHPPGFRP